jgi:hypothetical protein
MEISTLNHGYLMYALVDEGTTNGAADREPREGKITLREWLTAKSRVPKLQRRPSGQTRSIEHPNGPSLEAASGDEPQRPRLFLRRDSGASDNFIVSTTPSMTNSSRISFF